MSEGGLFEREPAVLVLKDARVFEGTAVVNGPAVCAEVVFNTALSGYQEVISDPSYAGQIVVMTYPHIGNYGANPLDDEASEPAAAGLVVRSMTRTPSNARATESFVDYVERHALAVIEGVDTRSLTRHIRSAGAMTGGLFTGSAAERDVEALVDEVRRAPDIEGRDLVSTVTTDKVYRSPYQHTDARFRVALLDFGVKRMILRRLGEHDCDVTVFPADSDPEDLLEMFPDGVMLSNGPGDPAAVPGAPERVGRLLGKVPVFGICLGHQIMGLALGATTAKLPFGHHGANHPVLDVETGHVEITSQNHGFMVEVADESTSAFGRIEVTHRNLNDGTLEGIGCLDIPAFSVQYHPEAGPGPHDSAYLFGRFTTLMQATKGSG